SPGAPSSATTEPHRFVPSYWYSALRAASPLHLAQQETLASAAPPRASTREAPSASAGPPLADSPLATSLASVNAISTQHSIYAPASRAGSRGSPVSPR